MHRTGGDLNLSAGDLIGHLNCRKWRIGGTTLACLLFGAAAALQFQLPALGVGVPNALLIMLPYLLALLAVGGLVGRQMAPATLGEPYRR